MTLSECLNYGRCFLVNRSTGKRQVVKGLLAFSKLAFAYFVQKRIVNSNDYGAEYDQTAATYLRWTDRMGKHTKKIIKPEYLSSANSSLEILDLSCGRGFITSELLKYFDNNREQQVAITGVDISSGMIALAKSAVQDARVQWVHSDGIEFLKQTPDETFDGIFFGWAFPYFDHRLLLPQLRRTLKKGGKVFLICNVLGTLEGIEDIFVEVIAEYPEQVAKIPEVSFQLPAGANGIQDLFEAQGFRVLETDQGNEQLTFDTPQSLYTWLRETGALVGTGSIFKSLEIVEAQILTKIEQRKRVADKYVINHRFAGGIFQKG